jgi:dUTP pyrophosphatase
LPPGHAALVLPRSGLAHRYGVTLVNTPGLIDAGYRDELKVVMINTDPHDAYEVHRGDRIAQLLIQPIDVWELVVVDTLEGESRGGGFGHTGR